MEAPAAKPASSSQIETTFWYSFNSSKLPRCRWIFVESSSSFRTSTPANFTVYVIRIFIGLSIYINQWKLLFETEPEVVSFAPAISCPGAETSKHYQIQVIILMTGFDYNIFRNEVSIATFRVLLHAELQYWVEYQ